MNEMKKHGTPPRQPVWNARDYEKSGRFVADLAAPVLDLLDPKPGERILDLGCGDGALTLQLMQRGSTVVGVDVSSELLNQAVKRGVDARLMSGQDLAFNREFDAVFSNAALHWMLDQDAVLAGVRRGLRPAGRFVAELGGHGNIAAIRTALQSVLQEFAIDAEASAHNVFFTPDEYRSLLESHGFEVAAIDLTPRPTRLPTGIRGWLQTFRGSLLRSLTDEQQALVMARVEDLLRPILCTRDGTWYADYVRLRFRAVAS